MSEPFYVDDAVTLYHGDCLDVLAQLPDCSVDAVVTDPPYGLEFMGREWDSFKVDRKQPGDDGYTNGPGPYGRAKVRYGQAASYGGDNLGAMSAFQAWCEQWAAECLRVLKPGGHMLAFGGTRTWHRLACAVEDAGFEVRDSIAWLYGSGFPKSLDVSKAIDKRRDWTLTERLAGEIRRARAQGGLSLAEIGQATLAATDGVYGKWYHRGGHMFFETGRSLPSRPEWEHLRRVLPIAAEFVEVYDEAEREVIGMQEGAMSGWAMDGTTRFVDRAITAPATEDAQRWQGWGTALKPAFEPIVVARKPLQGTVAANVLTYGTGALNIDACRVAHLNDADLATSKAKNPGRGDVVTSDVYGAGRPQQSVNDAGRWPANVVLDDTQAAELDRQSGTLTSGAMKPLTRSPDSDPLFRVGEDLTYTTSGDSGGASRFFPTFRYEAKAPTHERPRHDDHGAHPTVKPLDLMRWLVRLVTQSGGIVLDPFAGSGTTAEAAVVEGFKCIAVEREADYLPLIVARLSKPIQVGLDLDFEGEPA